MLFHAVAVFAVLLSIARSDSGIASHFDPRFPLAGRLWRRKRAPSRYYLSLSSLAFCFQEVYIYMGVHTVTHC